MGDLHIDGPGVGHHVLDEVVEVVTVRLVFLRQVEVVVWAHLDEGGGGGRVSIGVISVAIIIISFMFLFSYYLCCAVFLLLLSLLCILLLFPSLFFSNYFLSGFFGIFSPLLCYPCLFSCCYHVLVMFQNFALVLPILVLFLLLSSSLFSLFCLCCY